MKQAECPHCRSVSEIHGENCAIAKKKGLTREEPTLRVGMVGQYRENPEDDPRAAVIVGLDPLTIRAFDRDPAKDFFTTTSRSQWSAV